MRIDRLNVQRYRQLNNVSISFGDVTTLVGPNGSGKSTVLRALEYAIAGLSSTEVSAINGRPSLRDQLVKQGLPEAEITLTLSESEAKAFRTLLSNSPDVPPGVTTFGVKRELFFAQNMAQTHTRITAGASTYESIADPKKFQAIDEWLKKYSPLVIPAERKLGLEPSQEQPVYVPDGGTITRRFYHSVHDRTQGLDPLFRNVRKILSEVLPEFSEFAPVRRNSLFDVEFDGWTGLWMGSGHREIVTLIGEVVGSPAPAIAIEEIERGIHPGLIARLLQGIRSACGTRQLILSTHSAGVLSLSPASSIWEVTPAAELRQIGPDNLSNVARSLGLRPGDVLDQDVLLFVEGPSDEAAFNVWLRQEGLAPRCAAVDIGGFGNAKHYANVSLIKLRVRAPKVCVFLDGDVKRKSGGTRILEDAETFATSTGGKRFDAERDMLEDYLLDSQAIGEAIGKNSSLVEATIEQVRRERIEGRTEPVSAKAILSEALQRLRGSWYKPEEDAAAIAAKYPVAKLPRDIKEVIMSIKAMLS